MSQIFFQKKSPESRISTIKLTKEQVQKIAVDRSELSRLENDLFQFKKKSLDLKREISKYQNQLSEKTKNNLKLTNEFLDLQNQVSKQINNA